MQFIKDYLTEIAIEWFITVRYLKIFINCDLKVTNIHLLAQPTTSQ
jgi:hypothetical protein